jgi:TetR/AcrR family transcriptional repressor of nem operon
MQEADLTHGGFYRSFASKEALAAEACAVAMQNLAPRWSQVFVEAEPASLKVMAKRYLSPQHRDALDEGCALAALASEVWPCDGPLRHAFGDQEQGS